MGSKAEGFWCRVLGVRFRESGMVGSRRGAGSVGRCGAGGWAGEEYFGKPCCSVHVNRAMVHNAACSVARVRRGAYSER